MLCEAKSVQKGSQPEVASAENVTTGNGFTVTVATAVTVGAEGQLASVAVTVYACVAEGLATTMAADGLSSPVAGLHEYP